MVKQIVRDVFFLGQPSEPATKADIQVGKDLQDTLRANRERCVGMAANMIGVKKNIIIVNMGFIDVVMFNPVIVSKHDMYETEEGCLSLDGVRKTTRYQEIEVEYYDFNWKKQRQKLSGWTAQICQHEIDHLFLNFSDPWPKKRHAKRRLTSPDFLNVYRQLLKKDGLIEFKTDNRGLFEYSLQSVTENHYHLDYVSLDLHNSPEAEDNIMTEYEEKFSSKGNPINKLIAMRK